MILKYNKPAPLYNEFAKNAIGGNSWEYYSLAIGNGFFGANIFGRTITERIQISEPTLVNPWFLAEGKPDEVCSAYGVNNFAEILIDFNHENVTDFDLIKNIEGDEINKHDLDNAILLHKYLQITDSQASDERLWISLCFGKFYDYMNNRWSVDKKINLTEHWFCPHGQKRGLYFNGLARLYWCAKISYDDTLSDPYELTRFCFKDINIIAQMMFRGYANSKSVRLAILKGLKHHVDNGGKYSRSILLKILKYVSFLGGAYILDSFTEQELFDKVILKLSEYEKDKFQL